MRHTAIGGHHGPPTEAAAFWIFAGIVIVIAFGDVLTLLAVAFAIMTTAWWISRRVGRRVAKSEEKMGSVTHLRPSFTGLRDLKKTSAHASWRGPRAA